jgi:hypothetical protein
MRRCWHSNKKIRRKHHKFWHRNSDFQQLAIDKELNPNQWEVHLKRKRKDSAGSDGTTSMIKGGGYFGARTRQLHTA